MLIVGIFAIVSYGIWYTAVSNKSQAVADLQARIDDAHKNMNRIAKARAVLAQIATDEMKVKSYFVPESGIVGFIDMLETRGQGENVSVSVLSVATGGSPSKPVLLLTISLEGTFDAVMRTIGSIEYAPYAVSISSLSVASADAPSWHATLSLVVGSVPVRSATTTP